jgi:hypothetical protein
MDVVDAIKTRKSVREYLSKPVEDEKLNVILEAGRLEALGVSEGWLPLPDVWKIKR